MIEAFQLKKIPPPVKFIFLIYLTGVIVFSLLRLILLLLNLHLTSDIPLAILIKSFIIGISFDISVTGYLTIIPLICFFFYFIFKRNASLRPKIVITLLLFLFACSFFIACSDIPWFNHQQKRITISALQWTNSPVMMMKYIFTDSGNYPFLFLFILLISGFFFILKFIRKKTAGNETSQPKFIYSLSIYVLAFLLIISGIRGRLSSKSPIRWGTAFVSEYDFTNQLGLNPVYTFVQSYIDELNPRNRHLVFTDEPRAISMMHSYYGTSSALQVSPVARNIITTGNPHRYNIVLVLMESMTSYNMKAFGNKENLTPVLDELYNRSLSFPNFYSDGIHTFCGLYSSLYGMPSLPNRHHLKDLKNQQAYGGIAKTLSSKNYQTIFFTTHDEQFDNMGGFLKSNGFQKIISQKDYPHEKILNASGIPDHLLFQEVVNHLNEIENVKQPFFAAVLTGSNHGPYELPQGIPFKPNASDIRSQVLEYADWSVGEFMKSCKQQTWFDSTIFLFTGDHGAIIRDLDKYLTFHRVPFIVYAPAIISPEINHSLGGQIDIYPFIMGLLNEPFLNNSFGIDLLKEKRTFISFSYDEEYGAFSEDYFYISRKINPALYLINSEARFCKMADDKMKADSMLDFAKSVFQTHQWMIENRRLY